MEASYNKLFDLAPLGIVVVPGCKSGMKKFRKNAISPTSLRRFVTEFALAAPPLSKDVSFGHEVVMANFPS